MKLTRLQVISNLEKMANNIIEEKEALGIEEENSNKDYITIINALALLT